MDGGNSDQSIRGDRDLGYSFLAIRPADAWDEQSVRRALLTSLVRAVKKIRPSSGWNGYEGCGTSAWKFPTTKRFGLGYEVERRMAAAQRVPRRRSCAP